MRMAGRSKNRMVRFFISAAVLASSFPLFAVHAARQSSASSCPCTLRGRVVDSSGQPVGHALVRLSSNSRATLTDAEGKFQFDGLPEAYFTVGAAKPGYLSPELGSSLPPATSSLHLAANTPPVELKLTRESIFFGRVSDGNGQPLEGCLVTAIFHNALAYADIQHQALTDDEGRFRIAGLRPGSYYLAVRPPPENLIRRSRESSTPMGYAPVFYPGARDLSAATAL